MIFPTTYEEALAPNGHPDQVTEVLSALRKSRSKSRLAPPESLTWSYGLGVRVQGYSMADLFNGKAEAERLRQAALTEQEEIDELRANCMVSLQAEAGKWGGSAPIPKDRLPTPILEWTTQTVQERRRRQAEADALTPDERALVIEEAIKQLPGLVCVTVKTPEAQ